MFYKCFIKNADRNIRIYVDVNILRDSFRYSSQLSQSNPPTQQIVIVNWRTTRSFKIAGQKILKSIMARGCGMPITIICIAREHTIKRNCQWKISDARSYDHRLAHRQGASICQPEKDQLYKSLLLLHTTVTITFVWHTIWRLHL